MRLDVFLRILSVLTPIVAAVLLVPVVLVCAGVLPGVRFTREWITVTVRPEACAVSGVYEYTNPWFLPLTQGLSVPFPTDENHPAPATVRVSRVDPATGLSEGELPVRWLGGRHHITLRVPARSRIRMRVDYVQRSTDRSGTYILTTTRPWRRPLDFGEYRIRPECVNLTFSNYVLDGKDGLSFARRAFMPAEDWRYSWDVPPRCPTS